MTIAAVILESDDPAPVLIEGLTVRFFDTLGVFVTSAVTDATGTATVDLPDADYDLTFFKQGVSINAGMPQRITIDAADLDVPPNTYKVIAHIATLPEATDPLQICISGSIMDAAGNPTKDGYLVLQPCVETGVLSTKVLTPQSQLRVDPDENGEYKFFLLRGLRYRAIFYMIEQLFQKEPPELEVIAPDLPALSLHDLLFPVPINATFTPNTLALTAGDPEDDSIGYEVTYSDGSVNTGGQRPDSPPHTAISASSDDEAVATVALQTGGTVLVTPVAAGTANITIVRTVTTKNFVYDPVPIFTTGTLVVTVS